MIAALVLAAAAAHPCVADAQKLCPGIEPGGGRIGACLQSHKDDVSADCKAKMADFREDAQACEADIQKLCPGTKPGPERHQCMMQHKDQVSPACRDFFEKMRAAHGEGHGEGHEGGGAMAACRDDAKKLCARVKPGGGRIVECLKQHDSDLSPGCAAALK